MIKFVSTLIATLALTLASAVAAEKAGPQGAKALLDRAVAHLAQAGQDRAVNDFNNPKAGFVKGELYVFAIDLDGRYVASGANPKLSGTVVRDSTDAAGHPLFRQMIELARMQGEGKVDYVWLNRVSNKVEDKHSYIKRAGDIVLGVGYYD